MITSAKVLEQLIVTLRGGGRYWLFLDYDGTLAEFARTPAEINPDPVLNDLLSQLVRFPNSLRLVILSGRKLEQVRQLVSASGIYLAGTYGLEYQPPGGQPVELLDLDSYRPLIERVLPLWQELVRERSGFFIEDKGFSLALHAKYASNRDAEKVLTQARHVVVDAGQGNFRVLEGSRFLEVAPVDASKGQALMLLLKRFEWPDAGLLYFGDDARDEEAFEVVNAQGGMTILISAVERPSAAVARIESPAALRAWLSNLVKNLENGQALP